jgi:hypothetical protein
MMSWKKLNGLLERGQLVLAFGVAGVRAHDSPRFAPVAAGASALRHLHLLHLRLSASSAVNLSGAKVFEPGVATCYHAVNANPIWHTTFGRAAPRKLFRDDAALHRTPGKRRGVLLHRQLSLDDLPL